MAQDAQNGAAQARSTADIQKDIENLGNEVQAGNLDVQDLPKRLAELTTELNNAQKQAVETANANALIEARLEVAFDSAAAQVLGKKTAESKGFAYQTLRQIGAKLVGDIGRTDYQRYLKLAGDAVALQKFFVDEAGKSFNKEFGETDEAKSKAKDKESKEQAENPEADAMAQEAKDAVEDSNVGDSAQDNTQEDGASKVTKESYARTEAEAKVLDKFTDQGDEYNAENGITADEITDLATAVTRYQEEIGVPPNERLLRDVPIAPAMMA